MTKHFKFSEINRAKYNPRVDLKPSQSKTTLIAGDDLRGDHLQTLIRQAFEQCHLHTRDDAAAYCFHASRNQIDFETALMAAGWRVKQQLIWSKQMALGRNDYHYAHEPLFYCCKSAHNCCWLGNRTETTLFESTAEQIEKMSKEEMKALLLEAREHTTTWEEKKDPPSILQHPNQKPVSLASRALRNSTLRGDHVIDPFGGSGSTLIAAELQGRNALTMELSRGHTDAIIRRFAETFEYQQIKRNGKPFDPAKVHAEK